ncbi:MAG: hypothetical protein HON90_12320 [Halobacteriovoraceae bacterium]|nr:hypothetical protein [Halobacteriovoraceae bacterium]
MGESKTAYLFVGGIFGGLLRPKIIFSYFQDMEKLLQRVDPNCHTEFLQNPCWKSVNHGSLLISNKLEELCEKNGFEVVIISHSRGALELLNFSKNYPELAKHKNIKKFIFSSPLFGKSHVAEFLHQNLRHILPRGLKKALLEVSHDGVRLEAQELWSQCMNSIKTKSLLIKTATHNIGHIPLFLRPTYFIIKKYAGENDGVLALSSQISLPGIPEARFYSNHGAIFCNKRINRYNQVEIGDVLKLIQSEKKADYKTNLGKLSVITNEEICLIPSI